MSDMIDENIIILCQYSVTVDSIVKSDVLAFKTGRVLIESVSEGFPTFSCLQVVKVISFCKYD